MTNAKNNGTDLTPAQRVAMYRLRDTGMVSNVRGIRASTIRALARKGLVNIVMDYTSYDVSGLGANVTGSCLVVATPSVSV